MLKEIREILPQDYPFIFIDRILEFKEKEYLLALKNITINECYLRGHFPKRPIMPGVLVIEAMAQAAIVFFVKSYAQGERSDYLYYLGKVEAKFLRPVLCGDQLRIKVRPLKIFSQAGIVEAEAFVGDVSVVRATLGFSAKQK